jgi:CMP-N-acetylneuraminic acid synthetase
MGLFENERHFFQTHTTNPLLSIETIRDSIKTYYENLPATDSLFSVNSIQARTYWPDGTPINHELGKLKRTQDLTPVMEENSNFFIFNRESFGKTNSRIGSKPFLYATPKYESFEIDTEEDFLFISKLMAMKDGGTKL